MVGPMQSSHSYQYLTIVMELNNILYIISLLTNSTERGIRVLQAEIKVGRGGKI